jgi:hypothetical protein
MENTDMKRIPWEIILGALGFIAIMAIAQGFLLWLDIIIGRLQA